MLDPNVTKPVTMKQGETGLASIKRIVGRLGTPARKAKALARSLASAQSTVAKALGEPLAEFPINCWEDQRVHLINLAQRKKNEILEIDLRTAQAKLDTELGKLIPREQVNEREADLGEMFARGLASMVDLISVWAPANQIIKAQAAFRERADDILSEMADGIRAKRK